MNRFMMYQDAEKLWRWRLVAANGKIMADSGEGYASKGNCKKAIIRIKDIIYDAKYSIWDEE